MNDSPPKSIRVQNSIDRVKAGDPAARDELICCSCDRLDHLVMKMLGRYEQVKRWERVDFVLQRIMMRLYRSLEPVPLESSRDFLRQASVAHPPRADRSGSELLWRRRVEHRRCRWFRRWRRHAR